MRCTLQATEKEMSAALPASTKHPACTTSGNQHHFRLYRWTPALYPSHLQNCSDQFIGIKKSFLKQYIGKFCSDHYGQGWNAVPCLHEQLYRIKAIPFSAPLIEGCWRLCRTFFKSLSDWHSHKCGIIPTPFWEDLSIGYASCLLCHQNQKTCSKKLKLGLVSKSWPWISMLDFQLFGLGRRLSSSCAAGEWQTAAPQFASGEQYQLISVDITKTAGHPPTWTPTWWRGCLLRLPSSTRAQDFWWFIDTPAIGLLQLDALPQPIESLLCAKQWLSKAPCHQRW